MRVYPKPLEIGESEGFSPDKDLFGRAELARGMTNLVATVEDPLVIAFDGQWGSGKTTFLKMWAGELRMQGHPVIFFDAFENDYVEDAFAALARELVELVEEKLPEAKKVSQNIREKATALGALLIRGGAKVGLKLMVRAATGGLASSDEFKDLGDVVRSQLEDVADVYMEQLLDKPRQQKEVVESFRRALADLPSLLAPVGEGETRKPLIFIIDELDRCKPHFALSLLERVKHFMAVPNVHFVLGVHLRQLEASVRYAYGDTIDARAYLQKFIHLTISNVEKIENEMASDLHRYAKYLASSLEIPYNERGPLSSAAATIVRLVQHEEMSFRTLERAFTILALAISFTPPTNLQVGPVMGGLVMMKLLRPDLYRKAKLGTLTLDEVKAFLRFPVDQYDERHMSVEEKWWTYLLVNDLSDHLAEFGGSTLFRFHIRNRLDVLKYMANDVVDRLSS